MENLGRNKKFFYILFLAAVTAGAVFGYLKFKIPIKAALYREKMIEEQIFQETQDKGLNILFVGDIMLDRGVERLMEANSSYYPFSKIDQFLMAKDIIVANLEGPIVKEPINFPDSALQFAFKPETAKILSLKGFNLLSLANNHTLNMGRAGLEETKQLLKEEGINFMGDPVRCTEHFFHQENDVIFLGFNKIYPSDCSDKEIIAAVKVTRLFNPGLFLIVNIHWGEEYYLTNSLSQKNLAHQIIEAGADLIIGHHPHVVQNIELYEGKLIFYSLGNFIFDQYFSINTQQGLAVELELSPEAGYYKLFPIQSRLSQPFLMEENEAKIFLQHLAEKSGQELSEEIKNGVIDAERNKD